MTVVIIGGEYSSKLSDCTECLVDIILLFSILGYTLLLSCPCHVVRMLVGLFRKERISFLNYIR